MEYTKDFKERDELLDRLVESGLAVPDRRAALDFLTRVGYFRSGAYRYVFRQFLPPGLINERLREYRSDEYVSGSSSEHVMALEAFDSKLARVCLEGLLDFEVRVRASIAHTLARRDVAAHAHRGCLDADMCDRPAKGGITKFEAWTRTYESAIDDASEDEDFITHHISKYPNQPVPIWAVTEVLSFGNLPFLFDLMKLEDRREVALSFGFLQPKPFSAVLRMMVDMRNVCAHGSRLFNRAFKRALAVRQHETSSTLLAHAIGNDFSATPKPNQRLYVYSVVLAFMLMTHSSGSRWNLTFKTQVRKLDTSFIGPDGGPLISPEKSMGFPSDWEDLEIWR